MLSRGETRHEVAARTLLEQGFEEGAPIKEDWWRSLLGFMTEDEILAAHPRESRKAHKLIKRERMLFQKEFNLFVDHMHSTHGLLLGNVWSKGYAIVAKEAQLGVVYTEAIQAALRATRKALKRMKHIPATGRVEQARLLDAQNRMKSVQEAIQKNKRAPV